MEKKILVTGAHRSGSTWVGKVIAKAYRVRYLHEPFNLVVERNNSPLKYWFECIKSTDKEYQRKVKTYLNSFFKPFNLNHLKRIFKIRSINGVYWFFSDFIGGFFKRTVIKDPIAIMSAEWMYENYDMDVIVLIRHPAAFIASLKTIDWQFDFAHYLSQPVLMDDYLKNYKEVIKDFSENKKDIIEQGILLWNTIYDVVVYYQNKYKDDWFFIKHEDLSVDPIVEFKKIFSFVDLKITPEVENYIHETSFSSKENKGDKNKGLLSDVKRNSKNNIEKWKQVLSDDEIERIKGKTDKIWREFYSENDW